MSRRRMTHWVVTNCDDNHELVEILRLKFVRNGEVLADISGNYERFVADDPVLLDHYGRVELVRFTCPRCGRWAITTWSGMQSSNFDAHWDALAGRAGETVEKFALPTDFNVSDVALDEAVIDL